MTATRKPAAIGLDWGTSSLRGYLIAADGSVIESFSSRSLYLTGDLSPTATLDYLSGLLVGDEIGSAVASHRYETLPPIVIVGDASLCARYREGFAAFGVTQTRIFADSAAAGLWEIAGAAGLVPAACDSSHSVVAGRAEERVGRRTEIAE
jgi:2-keto-3-deoxy-galactonokinase